MWVLFEKENIMNTKLWKLQNKWNFVDSNTEILQHVLKMHEISLLPKYIKLISKGIFLGAFVCASARL
jgi:hypothetical protein